MQQYQQPQITETQSLSAQLGGLGSPKLISDAEVKHGAQMVDYEAPEISGEQELSGGLFVVSGLK